ncbi:MAG TPA: radical SAM protein [Azospirillaceae bacterium]|nr:radical SAM protein [Azospirillaceae bacterium]
MSGSVYSAHKLLRHPERVAAWLEGRPAAPVHVRIKPMNRCNHACWYCAYRADGLQLGEEMDEGDRLPADTLRGIARDLVGMGVRAVTFSGGGEPLLYRELPEIVEILGSGGVQVAALTNGSNLKGRMADAFARFGTWVRVSVDAVDDASYARARGIGPGQFTRLLRTMREFADRGSRCTLGVSLIVGAENAGRVAEACALFKEAGAAHVKLSGVVVGNDHAANEAYHAPLRAVVGDQIAQARRLEDAGFAVVDHYHALPERFDKPYRRCPMMRFLTVIGADGCVYACQDKAYTEAGRIGALAGRSFREFWFSVETQAFLAGFDPAAGCSHHCVSHAKNLMLDEVARLDSGHGAFV